MHFYFSPGDEPGFLFWVCGNEVKWGFIAAYLMGDCVYLSVGCNTVAKSHDMKISTWNLMRPTNQTLSRNDIFNDTIKKANSDILILTETNSCINPGPEYFSISTASLPKDFEGFKYHNNENRATIYSRFPLGRSIETADKYTSVCCEILLPNETLIVYATIIGITGGKDARFRDDFNKQKEDIRRLSLGNNICVVGDFNISLSGYIYPSNQVQKEANDFFDEVGLEILTRTNLASPDHIAISKSFLNDATFNSYQTAFNPKVTDHSFVTSSLHR